MKNIKNSVVAFGLLMPALWITPALDVNGEDAEDPSGIGERLVLSQSNSLLSVSSPVGPQDVVRTMAVIVTGYSSTPEQTDDTPFITASGKRVRDGIVATNLLPMGTKIRIPDFYGDRVFVVEDRMHPRNNRHVDIWFESYWDAKNFGAQHSYIEILES